MVSSNGNIYMLAQLCGPKANETEMGAALFNKNAEGRNFDFLAFFYNNSNGNYDNLNKMNGYQKDVSWK